MKSMLINVDNKKILNKENKDDYYLETNNELKVSLNFHNNNIISNIFSNLSLFEKINNIFTIENKTYMLKYCNNLNEDDFNISYFQKIDEKFIPISPWHNFNLMNEDGTYNMIVEITKYNYIKLEIKLTEKYNVIKQDKKKGKLRYYHNSIYWNYGALPQTYEYPKHIYNYKTKDNQQIFFTGDDDPLDIIDIGKNNLKMGEVVPVKILGAFTLIDEGQLDWKIIAINKYDKNFDNINSLDDIETYYPYTMNLLLEWFRSYKMAESKKLNIICKELYSKKESENLIKKMHEYYLEFLKDVKLGSNKNNANLNEHSNNDNINTNECKHNDFSNKIHDDSLYNNLLHDVHVSYYKANPSYKPNEDIWVP
ncbi:inorganic pyrophosphatase, putative [Plasmodium relictum]|uniref:inorganic diphosphatase n=1 Tax=Plasmodium relictum TaxID=85471 RepID=A0A1J1H264_PLARL|nr:inorganic pyrophosphatase, putative [Plasmodium relictum]CRG98757.1 inorganic pyrophosphatase, putative [Plasmodium relictum]